MACNRVDEVWKGCFFVVVTMTADDDRTNPGRRVVENATVRVDMANRDSRAMTNFIV